MVKLSSFSQELELKRGGCAAFLKVIQAKMSSGCWFFVFFLANLKFTALNFALPRLIIPTIGEVGICFWAVSFCQISQSGFGHVV